MVHSTFSHTYVPYTVGIVCETARIAGVDMYRRAWKLSGSGFSFEGLGFEALGSGRAEVLV